MERRMGYFPVQIMQCFRLGFSLECVEKSTLLDHIPPSSPKPPLIREGHGHLFGCGTYGIFYSY